MSPLPAGCLAAGRSPTPSCFTSVALLVLLPVLQCLPPTPPPLHLATSYSSMKAHPRRLFPGWVPFLLPKTLHASITSLPWNTITNCSMGLSSPLNYGILESREESVFIASPTSRTVLLNWEWFFSPGDMWQCLETFLFVNTGWEVLLISSEYRPAIKATMHRTASHIKALSDPKMSIKTLI